MSLSTNFIRVIFAILHLSNILINLILISILKNELKETNKIKKIQKFKGFVFYYEVLKNINKICSKKEIFFFQSN